MLRAFTLSVAILSAIFLAACGRQPASQPGPETPERLMIGAIPKSIGGEFWETVERGARQAADDLGVDIKWEGTATETEIAEQNKIIENMINLGVDGMALAPLNRQAQKKLVQRAVDADIPVVVFDSAVDGDAQSSFVATDNLAGGVLGAEHLLSLMNSPTGDIMVMRFVQGTASTEARAQGFIEKAEAAGANIVADPYPETGTIEGAKNVAANTLEGYVRNGRLELDGIFACNLVAALGVDSALEDLRKAGIEIEVKFVGFDTSAQLVKGLQNGSIHALVAQNPEKMGYLAVETTVKVLRDEPVEARVDTGVELVTREGLETEADIRALVGLE